MLSEHNLARFVGAKVVDPDGEKIGSVGRIFVGPQSGRPVWVTVKTGLFGSSETFVPIEDAEEFGEDLRVPFTKDVVKGAPRIDAHDGLSDVEEGRLREYYDPPAAAEDPDMR